MRKIELVLLLTTVSAIAQVPAPKSPSPAIPPNPTPNFTQLEQTIVKEIQAKHDELQQLVNEFLEEVRKAHPGYEFSNGSLVPIPPPAAPKPKEEKKP